MGGSGSIPGTPLEEHESIVSKPSRLKDGPVPAELEREQQLRDAMEDGVVQSAIESVLKSIATDREQRKLAEKERQNAEEAAAKQAADVPADEDAEADAEVKALNEGHLLANFSAASSPSTSHTSLELHTELSAFQVLIFLHLMLPKSLSSHLLFISSDAF